MTDENQPEAGVAPPSTVPTSTGARSVFGGLLIGCGILIAGLSGLCLIVIAGDQMGHPDPLARNINSALMMVSAFILAAGVGIIFLGRYLLNKGKRDGK